MTTTIKTLSNETIDLLELAGIETPEQAEQIVRCGEQNLKFYLKVMTYGYPHITGKDIDQVMEELKEYFNL